MLVSYKVSEVKTVELAWDYALEYAAQFDSGVDLDALVKRIRKLFRCGGTQAKATVIREVLAGINTANHLYSLGNLRQLDMALVEAKIAGAHWQMCADKPTLNPSRGTFLVTVCAKLEAAREAHEQAAERTAEEAKTLPH